MTQYKIVVFTGFGKAIYASDDLSYLDAHRLVYTTCIAHPQAHGYKISVFCPIHQKYYQIAKGRADEAESDMGFLVTPDQKATAAEARSRYDATKLLNANAMGNIFTVMSKIA